MISGSRSVWYGASEPHRLRWTRWRHRGDDICTWGRNGPLVTVYIPTHNRVDLLMERALPSVVAQTYRNIEIIVAAHGCTDGTVDDVRIGYRTSCAYGDRRIRVIEVPRRPTYPPTAENHWFAGPVDPCNAALRAARGDWIMRIDDDDKLQEGAIEKLRDQVGDLRIEVERIKVRSVSPDSK